MNYLVDTHILLWAALAPEKLSSKARDNLNAPNNLHYFSAISIWEVAIKQSLGRPDFDLDPGQLRSGLLANGYLELALSGRHCLALNSLPRIHGDPFDRMLIAQAVSEGMTLLTGDGLITQYPGPVEVV